MRMSISITSGRSALARATAWRPSAASPTTSMSSRASSSALNPAADQGLVIGEQDPDHGGPPTGRRAPTTANPPPGPGPGRQAAPESGRHAHACR